VQNDPVNFVDPSGLLEQSPSSIYQGHLNDMYRNMLIWVSMGSREVIETGGGTGIEETSGDGESPPTPNGDKPYPGCITPDWLLNNSEFKSFLNKAWQDTTKSGNENGGYAFYEPKTNTIHLTRHSEGLKASLPNEPEDFVEIWNRTKEGGREMIFIAQFHTHPGGTPIPSFPDVGYVHNYPKPIASAKTGGGGVAANILVYGEGKYYLIYTSPNTCL